MLAQAEFCPSQIGTIKFTVTWTLDELGLDAFEPGDVVLHNDPYRGSGHVPEHMMLKPVFWQGELFRFVANVAHMSEPGAKTPGGLSGDATEVSRKGCCCRRSRSSDAGEDDDDIWKIILANHRTPKVTYGDFRAMMASLDLAEERIHQLLDTYGVETGPVPPARVGDDRRAPHAGRDSRDPQRHVLLRGRDRGRRHHRPRLSDAARADRPATTRSSPTSPARRRRRSGRSTPSTPSPPRRSTTPSCT